ncbi:unnamed protein product, partial [Laminaria digitata]
TTDIWTSPNKKSLISLVVAYIVRTPGSWCLVSLDLECSLFQEAHNGDNIATKLIALMKGGGLDLTKCISTTTDNASNMVKGAADNPNLIRQACAVHTIELSVKRDGPAELQEVLKDCSAVVSHFSRSPKASQEMDDLAKVTAGNKFITLKVAVKTRWWTELTMLDSIFANEKTFNTMVTLDKAPASVKKLNWPKMRLMAVVLRPFADAAKMLEGEKYPTGGLVASTVGFL